MDPDVLETQNPDEIPYRRVEHQPGDEDPFGQPETPPGSLPVGSVHLDLYPRAISAAEKAQWRRDDAARDARRVSLGFRRETST